MRTAALTSLACLVAAIAATPASAAVTPTGDAMTVANAIAQNGVAVTGASFTSRGPSGNPSATADNAVAGFPTSAPTYGLLSSGDTTKAFDAQTGIQSGNNGIPMSPTGPRGNTAADMVVLKLDFTVPASANCITLDFRFFSEEFPSFVGSTKNDGFIAELDNSTWTTNGNAITAPNNFAFDPGNKVVSINATGPALMNAGNAAGTTYGGGTSLLHASTPATPGNHSLYLSIFDQGDTIYDSTVFLDKLVAGTAPAGTCVAGATDQPPPTGNNPPPPPPPPPPGGNTPPPTGTPPPILTPPVTQQSNTNTNTNNSNSSSSSSVNNGSTTNVFNNYTITNTNILPAQAFVLPSNRRCVSRRNFTVRMRRPPRVEYIAARVSVNGRQVPVRVAGQRFRTIRGDILERQRITAQVDLRGLPRGTFRVQMRAVTAALVTVTDTRRYRTCVGSRAA